MSSVLLGVGGAITLITFVGLCFVYLRGSADKGTIESQKRLVEAQEAELTNVKRRLGEAGTRVGTLESENQILRRAVAHVEELVQLQESQDRHHSEQVAILTSILTTLEALAA